MTQANTERSNSNQAENLYGSQQQQSKRKTIIAVSVVLLIAAAVWLYQVVSDSIATRDICNEAVGVAIREGLLPNINTVKIEEHDGTKYYFVTLAVESTSPGKMVNMLMFLSKKGNGYVYYYHLDEYWTNGDRSQWKLQVVKNAGY